MAFCQQLGWNLSLHTSPVTDTSTVESATTRGKCKFNKCWLEQPEFSWLQAVPHNEFEACSRARSLQDDPQLGHTVWW